MSQSKLLVPILMAAGMIAVFVAISSGMTLLVTFVPGVVVALVFYFLTCYQRQPPPDRILPLYLVGLAIQMLHFAEELLNDFGVRFPALLGADPYPTDLFVLFNMVAYAGFLGGAIIIFNRKQSLMMIPLFFIIYGMMGNAIAHTTFSIVTGGYFPGLYTSLLYWLAGPVIVRQIWKETRIKV